MSWDEVIRSYVVAEFVTLARDGSPVCWPMMPAYERGRVTFSTGLLYPTKARNAQRDPRVAALFSDPTGSGRPDGDPLVLVQGRAEVFDQDIQRNTERYVAQLTRKLPVLGQLLRIGLVRRAMAGYLARIWIEMTPEREHIWTPGSPPPAPIRSMGRPERFVPRPGISLDRAMAWLRRYPRDPVLAYVDTEGRPAAIRVAATPLSDHIELGDDVQAADGAPASVTYHRLVGNYRANDAFLIRGHMDAHRFIPERIVGYGGTRDDRGVGSLKLLELIRDLSRKLPSELAREGRPPLQL